MLIKYNLNPEREKDGYRWQIWDGSLRNVVHHIISTVPTSTHDEGEVSFIVAVGRLEFLCDGIVRIIT